MPYNEYFRRFGVWIIVLFLIAIVILGYFVHLHSILGLDIFLSRDLQAEGDTPTQRSVIHYLMSLISLFGKPVIAVFLIFFTAIFFWLTKAYREAKFVLFVPLASLINSIIKLIVARPRPTDTFVQILDKQADYSFPSGHVVFYTVFFGFLVSAMLIKKDLPQIIRIGVGIISVFLIVAVSFSRVYLGAHWASDVIAGYCLGFILLSLLLYFYLKSPIITKGGCSND